MDPRDAISNENGTCYGIVEVAPGNLFKIGNPFLRNVYTYAFRWSIVFPVQIDEYAS